MCTLCGHQCVIAPGLSGRCRVRLNQDARLQALNYGRLLAANADPIEKKPLFHFKPGGSSFSIAAAGCNFHCDFCQNWSISQTTSALLKENARLPLTAPAQVVAKALTIGCASISYTYTEPIVFWDYALDCMALAKDAGLDNIVVSNGFGSPTAWRAAQGLLDAANIDLKAFDNDFYTKICGGRLSVVLDSLRQLKKMGVWLEITTLLIPGLNDDPDQLRRLALFIANELSPDTPWHVSAYRPAYKRNNPATGYEHLLCASEAGRKAGLHFVYLGNAPGLKGENTVCPACQAVVVERRGFTVINKRLAGDTCTNCQQPVAGVWI